MEPALPFQVEYATPPPHAGDVYWKPELCRIAERSQEKEHRDRLLACFIRDREISPDQLFFSYKAEIASFIYIRNTYKIEAITEEGKIWFDHFLTFAQKAQSLAKKVLLANQKLSVTVPHVNYLAGKIRNLREKSSALNESISKEAWENARRQQQKGKPIPYTLSICGKIAVMSAKVNNVMGACLMGIQTNLTDELPELEDFPIVDKAIFNVSKEKSVLLENWKKDIERLKLLYEKEKQAYFSQKIEQDDDHLAQVEKMKAIHAGKKMEYLQPSIEKLFNRAKKVVSLVSEKEGDIQELYFQLIQLREKCEARISNLQKMRLHQINDHMIQAFDVVPGEGIREMSMGKNTPLHEAYEKAVAFVQTLLTVTTNVLKDMSAK